MHVQLAGPRSARLPQRCASIEFAQHRRILWATRHGATVTRRARHMHGGLLWLHACPACRPTTDAAATEVRKHQACATSPHPLGHPSWRNCDLTRSSYVSRFLVAACMSSLSDNNRCGCHRGAQASSLRNTSPASSHPSLRNCDLTRSSCVPRPPVAACMSSLTAHKLRGDQVLQKRGMD